MLVVGHGWSPVPPGALLRVERARPSRRGSRRCARRRACRAPSISMAVVRSRRTRGARRPRPIELAEGGRRRARGHAPISSPSLRGSGSPRARRRGPRASKPTSCRAWPVRGALLDRLVADEAALVALDEAVEPGLERRGLVVELVAVERERGLEPQRVARAEPARHRAAPSIFQPASRSCEDARRRRRGRSRSRPSRCSRCARRGPRRRRSGAARTKSDRCRPRQFRRSRRAVFAESGPCSAINPVSALRSRTPASSGACLRIQAIVLLDVRGVHAQEEHVVATR